MSSTPDTLTVTAEERAAIYFIPQQVGGKVVSEEMQQRLQEKGLVTAPLADGRRWITILGDEVRRGRR